MAFTSSPPLHRSSRGRAGRAGPAVTSRQPRTTPSMVMKTTTKPAIKMLSTPTDLKAHLSATSPSAVTVVKCFAPYCRSCKGAEPKYRKIAAAYTQAEEDPDVNPIAFCQMDFSLNEAFCRQELGVSHLPFFGIFRGDQYVGGEAMGWQSVTSKLSHNIETALTPPHSTSTP